MLDLRRMALLYPQLLNNMFSATAEAVEDVPAPVCFNDKFSRGYTLHCAFPPSHAQLISSILHTRPEPLKVQNCILAQLHLVK